HLQVEFQDQSQLLLKHSEIHSLEHELPKRVRARLAIPAPGTQQEAPKEGAQAAKRRRLPSKSLPQTPMETQAEPPQLNSPAQDHHSVTPPSPRLLPLAGHAPNPSAVHTDSALMDQSNGLANAGVPATVAAAAAALSSPLASDPTLTSGSPLVSDPTLTSVSAPYVSALNSDPLLLPALSPPPPQHLGSDDYTPSSSYVSYMEKLMVSHFPQDEEPDGLY
ncbi:hypothetical protein CRUP_007437, partial [Coryphaenoides rupestris]